MARLPVKGNGRRDTDTPRKIRAGATNYFLNKYQILCMLSDISDIYRTKKLTENFMNTYNLGDKVKVNGKTGTITQVFPGDDVTTYEVTYPNGTTSIECL